MAQIVISDIVTLRDRGKYQGIVWCVGFQLLHWSYYRWGSGAERQLAMVLLDQHTNCCLCDTRRNFYVASKDYVRGLFRENLSRLTMSEQD